MTIITSAEGTMRDKEERKRKPSLSLAHSHMFTTSKVLVPVRLLDVWSEEVVRRNSEALL